MAVFESSLQQAYKYLLVHSHMLHEESRVCFVMETVMKFRATFLYKKMLPDTLVFILKVRHR